jgi:2-furoyl-CoA dehydrogenase large subunit
VLNQLFEQLGREAGGKGAAVAAPSAKRGLLARILALFGVQR